MRPIRGASGGAQAVAIGLLFAMTSICGCMLVGNEGSDSKDRLRAVDGLVRVELPVPGLLDLRDDHGIGGYDAFVIPDATLSYRQGSRRLTDDAKQVFLQILRDSLVDASSLAAIPIHEAPGRCTMQINLAVHQLDVDPSDRAEQLARMMLVMEFRDSESGEPLLRYAREHRVENPEDGVTPDATLRTGLVRVIKEMDLSTSLRGAGLADDVIRPGCVGTLAARGRAATRGR